MQTDTLIPKHIGVVAHPRRPESIEMARDIVAFLSRHQIENWMSVGWDEQSRTAVKENTDVVIAIGGDGAMLRAVRTCGPLHIPVLGINMGYLGFLPEVNPPYQWEPHVDRLIKGDFWIEQRMTLDATVIRDGKTIARGAALNDVVINRSRALGTVLLQTYIDTYWATTYHADALIIATATGSTAYALAAGGPILPPELHNILIIPVAPHLSMDRPIVLSEGATVQVIISQERENDVTVILDGIELCHVKPKDCVAIRAGKNNGLFVRMRDKNYFYRSLLDRLEPRVPPRATPDTLKVEMSED